ncbi:hypothetical protein [Methanocrinis sp.]|uniref:hypothetical protein n=1 Tax=Methanocrinis sp. TaxID=3101522 RepID=UPI003D13D9B5
MVDPILLQLSNAPDKPLQFGKPPVELCIQYSQLLRLGGHGPVSSNKARRSSAFEIAAFPSA